jgi:hypothetical protein
MQKVVGSSPIIRFGESPAQAGDARAVTPLGRPTAKEQSGLID